MVGHEAPAGAEAADMTQWGEGVSELGGYAKAQEEIAG